MTTYIIPPTVLYIKQHSVTKLKYFGKTTKDPYKYNGSGKHWAPHIKKHGRKHIITTNVFGPFTNSIAISEFALAFSKDHNIVNSDLWANQKLENGLDGALTGPQGPRGPQQNPHGPTGPTGPQQNPSGPRGKQQNPSGPTGPQQNPHGPRGPTGPQQNPSGPRGPKQNPSGPHGPQQNPALKVKCPHCGLVSNPGNMKQHHFDNCKKNPSNLDHPVPAVL